MARTYSLKQLIEDMDEVVHETPSETEILARAKPLLKRDISGHIPRDVFISRRDKYAMNLIHRAPDKSFSVIGAVWRPGQTTPIHNHMTWALLGVHEGEEKEATFRRVDNHSDPKFAKLRLLREKVRKKGDISVLTHAGIHRVDNVTKKTSRSIHIYGRDIGNVERHSYDPLTGEISKFVSGYCNVIPDTDEF